MTQFERCGRSLIALPNESMQKFINRERELQSLSDLWEADGAQLLVVYGRRRTGKTTLLTHFGRTVSMLYWTASQSSPTYLLRSFSQTLWRFRHEGVSADFSFGSWEEALRYAGELAQHERLFLVLDEFAYAMESDRTLPSILQMIWDHVLKETKLFLVLAGSHVGMMQKHFLGYRAPLYGRATSVLRLRPMSFTAARQFMPAYSTAQAITIHAAIGGIPAYLERLNGRIPPLQNIHHRPLLGQKPRDRHCGV